MRQENPHEVLAALMKKESTIDTKGGWGEGLEGKRRQRLLLGLRPV